MGRIYDNIRPAIIEYDDNRKGPNDEHVTQYVERRKHAIGATATFADIRGVSNGRPTATHGPDPNIRHAARRNRLAGAPSSPTDDELPRARNGPVLSQPIPPANAPRAQAQNDNSSTVIVRPKRHGRPDFTRSARDDARVGFLPTRHELSSMAGYECYVWYGRSALPHVRRRRRSTTSLPSQSSDGTSWGFGKVPKLRNPSWPSSTYHFSMFLWTRILSRYTTLLDGLLHF